MYAIGIDSQSEFGWVPGGFGGHISSGHGAAIPDPVPVPDAGGAAAAIHRRHRQTIPRRIHAAAARMDDRVNAFALREITDDSGGRTEIVRSTRDLNPATTGSPTS